MSEEKKEDEPLIVGWDKSEEGTTVVFARSLPDGRIEIVDERRDLSREILEMIDERFRERHPDLSRQVVVFSNPPRGAMSDWLRERFAEPIRPLEDGPVWMDGEPFWRDRDLPNIVIRARAERAAEALERWPWDAPARINSTKPPRELQPPTRRTLTAHDQERLRLAEIKRARKAQKRGGKL